MVGSLQVMKRTPNNAVVSVIKIDPRRFSNKVRWIFHDKYSVLHLRNCYAVLLPQPVSRLPIKKKDTLITPINSSLRPHTNIMTFITHTSPMAKKRTQRVAVTATATANNMKEDRT
jgi:hypothetical protein